MPLTQLRPAGHLIGADLLASGDLPSGVERRQAGRGFRGKRGLSGDGDVNPILAVLLLWRTDARRRRLRTTLFTLSVASHRPAGRDVEISHIFMGVAMAGMFVGQWAFGRSAVWEIIFGALLIWFLVETIQSLRTYGLHLPHAIDPCRHELCHALDVLVPDGGLASGDVDVGVGDPKLDNLASSSPSSCSHRRSSLSASPNKELPTSEATAPAMPFSELSPLKAHIGRLPPLPSRGRSRPMVG